MKTVGLITEYNPFHNGHLYHIERARELTGADRVVIVMSGDYVQRGTPALLSKHSRAHMALLNGASAICELPVCYASGSAEFFAQGAISILEGLGCIDTLCFGSECGELSVLQHIAQLLLSESDTYSHMLQDALKKGHSFPAARHQALEKLTGDASVSQILSEPNNILGIEYLKALKKQNSRIHVKAGLFRIPRHKTSATVKFCLCHSECPETLGKAAIQQISGRSSADTGRILRTVAEPAS